MQKVSASHGASEGFCGVKGAPLGSITESASANQDETTKKLDGARVSRRRKRYDMLKTSAKVLGKKHRVSSCQKVPTYAVQNGISKRGISKNQHGHAHFHGVGSCGDVWACPICAQKIAEGRRREILHGLAQWRKMDKGNKALMITRTFSHSNKDSLSDIIKRFQKAVSAMKGSRPYKRILDSIGYKGAIRALEVTHGVNGWHPHHHEIVLINNAEITQAMLDRAEREMYELWVRYCEKHGLGRPSRKHGIRIDYRKNGEEAVGAYISKFGFELTYGHTKRGKEGSRTPWGILEDVYESEQQGHFHYGDYKLFKEYAEAMKGRAQLYWSRGLKDLLAVDEFTDEELADKAECDHVRDVNDSEWRAIVKLGKHAEVLELAERKPENLDGFISSLVDLLLSRDRERMREDQQRRRWIRESTLAAMQGIKLNTT